jgi:putative PIN family toxin of toxin-antitoxin system
MAAEKGRFELVVSEHLLNEVQDVLERPKMRRYLSVEEVPHYLNRVWEAGTPASDMTSSYFKGSVPEDPDDDYIPGLAIMGRAEAIVSGDKHLLDLRTKKSSGISTPILTPREFLEQLEGKR